MKLVLDTNVTLDWLLFKVPALEVLSRHAGLGAVTIQTHELVIEELRRVLGYPQLKVDATARAAILEAYCSQTVAMPLEQRMLLEKDALPSSFPRCRDPDDDRFLALAWHSQADSLVSKDKRVLKLQRHSRRFGFSILTVPQLVAALAEIA